MKCARELSVDNNAETTESISERLFRLLLYGVNSAAHIARTLCRVEIATSAVRPAHYSSQPKLREKLNCPYTPELP